MSDSIVLRIRFDRDLTSETTGASMLPAVCEVFQEQLSDVLLRGCADGTAWGYGRALVTAVEVYEEPDCTCDDLHGCPACFRAAEDLVGKTIRDQHGREWVVENTDEKDGYPTIGGGSYWARPDDVEVVA